MYFATGLRDTHTPVCRLLVKRRKGVRVLCGGVCRGSWVPARALGSVIMGVRRDSRQIKIYCLM
jgi:hypothetical protein